MASFDLLGFLSAFLGGFNVTDLGDKVTVWLRDEGAKYPDLQEKTNALADWLTTVLTEAQPNLDPAVMKLTVMSIASSIVHGTAGVDPDAWMFG